VHVNLNILVSLHVDAIHVCTASFTLGTHIMLQHLLYLLT
jgi:hypothetical protein